MLRVSCDASRLYSVSLNCRDAMLRVSCDAWRLYNLIRHRMGGMRREESRLYRFDIEWLG
ncbi:MAG: hypothetical protein VSS75_023825 [Candidatus Parabeggiatoa sp.]|nr:hypothetical protein [Candidatus Parabeggiatoa sp.]